MINFLMLLILGLSATVTVYVMIAKRLKRQINEIRNQSEINLSRGRDEINSAIDEAQKLVDQQLAEMNQEAERIRKHYEKEALATAEKSKLELAAALDRLSELEQYASLQTEANAARKMITEAIQQAEALRDTANKLIEEAREAAKNEKRISTERANLAYEEADALLAQATRDAGRIMADAEKRAEETGEKAYIALRDKETLEKAVASLWNITEGYGDRYVVPTHSILDDLAASFGYTEAGQALRSAREQSRRMIEEHIAATCNYDEPERRDRANRFVVDAFNGRVDAILSRVKSDNYGTLEQEIRDAYAIVNLNGLCFRDARILPAYLDSRLSELKWAVVVNELAIKQREEQRALRERLKDEERARKEQAEMLRQAAKEEELRRKAKEESDRQIANMQAQFARASSEEKASLETQLQTLQSTNDNLRTELAAATEKTLTIAQQTTKGHVYVISNIGTFGESVLKIGQTRREPNIRVAELGDASVPFNFDIHALIESNDAPALEHKLQRCFLHRQVNKMNSRKEFFKVTLKEIREEIDKLKQGEDFTLTHWSDLAVATQYRESLDIEGDQQKLDKWLQRQSALAERDFRRDKINLSITDIESPDIGDEAS